MKRTNMAIIAVVAVVVVVCALFAYATHDDVPSEDDGRFDYELPAITDETMEWMPADRAWDVWDSAVEEYLAASGTEGADMEAAFSAFLSTYTEVDEDTTLFQWAYSRDPGSLSDQYALYATLYQTIWSSFEDALRESLLGPNGDEVRNILGDGEADRILGTEPTPEGVEELMVRENELVDLCLNATDGESAAEWFLELVDIRNSIAGLYGYAGYPEYAYAEVYYRDYSPGDTESIRDAYLANNEAIIGTWLEVDRSAVDDGFTYTDQEELFDAVEPFIDSVCPEFAEVYDYMRANGLIDYEYLETKQEGCFTDHRGDITYIFGYPYLDGYDATVLVHEFGHAANFLLTGGTGDIDISEIQSTGLESLLALDPGMVLDGDVEALSDFMLWDKLSSILFGIAVDEFEQRVYADEAGTAEELDELWYGIFARYGIGPGYGWWELPHLFTSPLYYISYAVSAFNSLEIFVDGLEDRDAAVDEYLDVVAWTESGYIGMTEALGMMNVFDPEDFNAVIGAVTDHILA